MRAWSSGAGHEGKNAGEPAFCKKPDSPTPRKNSYTAGGTTPSFLRSRNLPRGTTRCRIKPAPYSIRDPGWQVPAPSAKNSYMAGGTTNANVRIVLRCAPVPVATGVSAGRFQIAQAMAGMARLVPTHIAIMDGRKGVQEQEFGSEQFQISVAKSSRNTAQEKVANDAVPGVRNVPRY